MPRTPDRLLPVIAASDQLAWSAGHYFGAGHCDTVQHRSQNAYSREHGNPVVITPAWSQDAYPRPRPFTDMIRDWWRTL